MNGFIKKEKSEISNKLAKFTKDAFFEYVLPKIEKECPCVIGKFFVILTSSVAYGIADKYSDIDVFVIFPKHKDYLTYYKKLQTLIDSIEYPSNYYNICDKGIRFEFESFFKSDLEKLINNQSNNNWLNQTEWLLCWFINSVTIYDPNGICERNKKKLQYYPKKIIKFKANNNLLLLLKFRRIMRRMNDSYVFDVYYFKSIKRLMDLIYWCEGLYVPHSKWSFHITAYLETLGEHFHKEVSQILNSDKSSKILLIDKWIKILIDKYSSQLFINKRLKRYIDNGFYIEINKKSLVKSNLYFKDHIGPMKKLDLIFQYL